MHAPAILAAVTDYRIAVPPAWHPCLSIFVPPTWGPNFVWLETRLWGAPVKEGGLGRPVIRTSSPELLLEFGVFLFLLLLSELPLELLPATTSG
jgi:hypothetical protein